MWLKYRHNFADAKGEWEYHSIGNTASSKEELFDYCQELKQKYDWSEHYRGIDYDLVKIPPEEVLKEKLIEAKAKMISYQNMIAELEEEIKELEK
jgi:hypothetical protein